MAFSIDLAWTTSWPIYAVYPASVAFFASFYLSGPRFWPCIAGIGKAYRTMSDINQMCWRQNVCALVHAVVVVNLLVAAIAIDPYLREYRPIHPYHSLIGYTALCVSLGYFTFAIPWTYRLYFCKGERQATNLSLVIHHAVVWIGALSYLLGRTCALYGAVAFACMEFTVRRPSNQLWAVCAAPWLVPCAIPLACDTSICAALVPCCLMLGHI